MLNSLHVGQKRKKEQISLAADLFEVLPIEARSSDDLLEADFQ
jgi:hypothetical protein